MAFAKFSEASVSGMNKAKSSVIRGIRQRICEQYPYLEDSGAIEEIMPKKADVVLAKASAGGETNNVQMVVVDRTPTFFNMRDGPYYPTLRLLHMYPDMMPKLRVDRGAIKFVLSGANIMCPGLTSPGATIHDEVDTDMPVAIFAEGKDEALAFGITRLSTKDIVEVNKGIGVDLVTYLNDGLWKNGTVLGD